MNQADLGRKEVVRELQEYLRTVARFDGNLPLIIPDGIFGPETTEAVQAFQIREALPATGAVDEITWDVIVLRYREVVRNHAPAIRLAIPLGGNGELKTGDNGDMVYFLQIALRRLRVSFRNLPLVSITGVYDEATIRAVGKMQEKSSLPVTGMTDRRTWNVIARAYNIAVKPTRDVPGVRYGESPNAGNPAGQQEQQR